ncbi:MAG TPA: hypothetical protein VJX67_15015, partial [Blastocatellia bacterium]|nr:hypothetical protein [Blastocatellia bacterium]
QGFAQNLVDKSHVSASLFAPRLGSAGWLPPDLIACFSGLRKPILRFARSVWRYHLMHDVEVAPGVQRHCDTS